MFNSVRTGQNVVWRCIVHTLGGAGVPNAASGAGRFGGGNKPIYVFGSLGGLLFGYDTGVISGAILFIREELGLTPFLEGLVVASLLLGAAVGAGTPGPLSDKLGRRNIIIIAAALIVPLYLSEIAPTQIRGAISSLNQLNIVFGILFAYIVNALLASSGAWRWMLGLAVIPSFVLLIGMFFLPETPRWLVSQDRD